MKYRPNPNFHLRRHKRFRNFLQIVITVIFGMETYRLLWLFVNWKSYAVYHLEECVINFIGWNLILLQNVFCYNILKKQNLLRVGNQAAIETCYESSSNRKQDLIVLPCVYGLVLEFWCCPLGALFGPLFIKIDPIQLFFGSSIEIKLVACITYFLIFCYGVTFILSVVLTSASFLEMQILFSNKLKHSGSKFAENLVKDTANSTISEFYKCHQRFAKLRILFILGNEMSELVFTAFIFVGVMLITCTAYATITMYELLPTLTYICMPFATVAGFGIAVIFTLLASIPGDNSNEFKEYWRQRLYQKKARMLLDSTPQVGYKMGPYGQVTNEMGLTICDDYVQNTVDLLLMRPVNTV